MPNGDISGLTAQLQRFLDFMKYMACFILPFYSCQVFLLVAFCQSYQGAYSLFLKLKCFITENARIVSSVGRAYY